jgi:hypothetical protein
MVEITEITVSYSRKVQVERFEPVEVHQSVTARPGEGDDLDELREDLYQSLRESVERQIAARLVETKFEAEGDGD